MSNKVGNIDSKLPVGWKYRQLGDVANTTSGGTPNRGVSSFWNGNIPWLKSGELKDGLIVSNSEFITEDGLNNSSAKLFPKGALLIAMYGATAGRLGILNFESSTNQAICSIASSEKIINRDFIYNYLFSKRKKIIKDSFGGAQPNISQGYLRSLEIPLPSLSEQKKIVNLLDKTFEKIDKSISLLEDSVRKIEELNKSVLSDVFNGLHNCKKDKLVNISVVKRGKSKHRPRNDKSLYGGPYPLIQTGDIRNSGKFLTSFSKTYNKKGLMQSKLWKKGTVCLTIAANIGDVSILGIDACFPDSVVGIHSDNVNEEFIYYFLMSIKEELNRKSSAVAQKNLSVEKLSTVDIPLPNLSTQAKIVTCLNLLFERNQSLLLKYEDKIQYFTNLKYSILNSAFKGKLRKQQVKQVLKQTSKYQRMGFVYATISSNKKQGIKQGQMAIAKDMYLLDRLYGLNSGFQYQRYSWGAFDPEIKQLVNTKKHFETKNYPNSSATFIDIKDDAILTYVDDTRKQIIIEGVKELNDKIFSKYKYKGLSYKKELLATVLMCMQDSNSTDFETIRQEMQNWKIEQKKIGSKKIKNFANKAEKFNKKETDDVIKFIVKQGWDKKVIV